MIACPSCRPAAKAAHRIQDPVEQRAPVEHDVGLQRHVGTERKLPPERLYALSIKGSPDQVRVIEGYADYAAYEAHLTTPHFLKYKTLTAAMVRSLRLLETEPISLKTKGQISN